MNPNLAQKIADEVMNGLGYNINVMNQHGIIVGSGNKDRIGNFHEVAMAVLKSHKILEVTEKESDSLIGVQAGINLPILDDNGYAMGVIGITGDPDKIRNLGKLVKMAAELIINQDKKIKNFYDYMNDKNLLVSTLISESTLVSQKELLQWGERIGFDLELPRVACIFLQDPQSPYTSDQLLEYIKSSPLHTNQDISVVRSNNHILVFKVIENLTLSTVETTLHDYVDSITSISPPDVSFQVFVGSLHAGLSSYQLSYEDALTILENLPTNNQDNIFFSHRHVLPLVYNNLSTDYKIHVLDSYIHQIFLTFRNGMEAAMVTMQSILTSNNYEETAKELFLHKNTVLFRKNKLCECLGFNIKSNPEDAVLLRLIVHHYFKSKQTK